MSIAIIVVAYKVIKNRYAFLDWRDLAHKSNKFPTEWLHNIIRRPLFLRLFWFLWPFMQFWLQWHVIRATKYLCQLMKIFGGWDTLQSAGSSERWRYVPLSFIYTMTLRHKHCWPASSACCTHGRRWPWIDSGSKLIFFSGYFAKIPLW